MAGDHSASAHARCSGTRVVRLGTNYRSYCRWGLRRQGRLLRRCEQPVHYVRHVSNEIEVTILFPHLTPGRLGKKPNDGRKATRGGCALWHAGSERAGKEDVDADVSAQDVPRSEACRLKNVQGDRDVMNARFFFF